MVEYSIPCSRQFFKSQNQKLGLRKKYCRVAALRDHPFKSSFFHIFFALSLSLLFLCVATSFVVQTMQKKHTRIPSLSRSAYVRWMKDILHLQFVFSPLKNFLLTCKYFFSSDLSKKNYLRLSICYNTVCI